MAVQSFGAGNKNVKNNGFERYKGEKGKIERVGIVFDLEGGEDPFSGAETHYHEGSNTRFMCKSENDGDAVCCTASYKGNDPTWKIMAAIVVYQVTDGKVTGGKVLPWVFNSKTYKLLERINSDFPWGKHDLELECTDTKYQSFTIVAKKESLWNSDEKFKETCLASASKVKKNVKSFLGRDLSLQEIRETLGLETSTDDASSGMDLGGLASSLNVN
jgi:hypothetical protein